jgi:DNA polymerase III epsilon subunit-like protein
MLNYYILDLETTGLSLAKHEVTQISIIRCADRNQLSKYIKAEFPENADPTALRITGRTMQDILSGDNKEDVVSVVDKFLAEDNSTPENRCMVGHNVHRFDLRFTHALWSKVGKVFPANLWLDTIPFTKAYATKKGIAADKFNLDASLEIAGIKKVGTAHNAIVDTRNNYKLWLKCVEEGIDHLPCIKRVPHSLDSQILG